MQLARLSPRLASKVKSSRLAPSLLRSIQSGPQHHNTTTPSHPHHHHQPPSRACVLFISHCARYPYCCLLFLFLTRPRLQLSRLLSQLCFATDIAFFEGWPPPKRLIRQPEHCSHAALSSSSSADRSFVLLFYLGAR